MLVRTSFSAVRSKYERIEPEFAKKRKISLNFKQFWKRNT